MDVPHNMDRAPPTAVHSHSQSHKNFAGRRLLTRSTPATNRSFACIHRYTNHTVDHSIHHDTSPVPIDPSMTHWVA